MVRDGLITKEKDRNDKRSYVITITEKGIDVAKKVETILQDWETLINQSLTKEEQNQLEVMRKKVYINIKNHFEKDKNHETNV